MKGLPILDFLALKKWFYLNRRALPWREDPTPYKVWISEVMLQQTRAEVVISYFKRWLTLFPSIQALAESSLEKVIKAWEGLGYYKRARNLHEGAKFMVEHFNGELPAQMESLRKIKGLGPYTIGAILSFAFKKRKGAVDGNVLRVFSRFFLVEDPIDQGKTRKRIEELVERFLPEEKPWVAMEALIELGALVCQKKAKCLLCPLKSSCLAYANHKTELLPIRGKKVPIIHLQRFVFAIIAEGKILLKKGVQGEIMADLWEFPYSDFEPLEYSTYLQEKFGLTVAYKERLPKVVHSFTKYKAHLFPRLFSAEKAQKIEGYEWVCSEELHSYPFSSGHRQVLKEVFSRCYTLSCNHYM